MKFLMLFSLLSAVFTNPILHSDYSDPDAICVDGEYWMVSSSFNCIPGLQILHSTNLVDWEIINAGIPRSLSPEDVFASPRHGCGVWAPAIRHFNGKFWIFWGDPDYGVFQIHADHPAGEWSKPVHVWKGRGIIDPCPLVDDDGRIYLVHAWAGSRAGFKSVLAVCELDSECTRFVGEQILVFDGKKTDDDTIEGPKFYKRDGWYYIFAPSGGVKEGWQVVLRSKNIYGPYEYKRVLHQGSTAIHGPHQGAWVEDAAGDSWFLHFEDRGAYGRVVHLQPMKWLRDGWCTMGKDINGDGVGEPVSKWRMPAAFPDKTYPRSVSALSVGTDFTHEYIPYNWQWHSNPADDWALLCPAEGYLRLNCIQSPARWRNLWDTPNLLLTKVVGPQMQFDAELVFRPSYEGDRAGLVLMGLDYFTLEFVKQSGKVCLRRVNCIDAESGAGEFVCDEVELVADDNALKESSFYTVRVRLNVRKGGICSFSYSLGSGPYVRFGQDFKMREGKWIGAKVGFFALAQIRKNDSGSLEVR